MSQDFKQDYKMLISVICEISCEGIMALCDCKQQATDVGPVPVKASR